MAKPTYDPQFYLQGIYLNDPSPETVWTPDQGGMHLYVAAHCQNQYGLGYRDIIMQPRFAEAINLIDEEWGVRRWLATPEGGGAEYHATKDPRFYDAALRVTWWLYFYAGYIAIRDDCNRPGKNPQDNNFMPNPNGIEDPVHFLYDRGRWSTPPGYKAIGYDPNPWAQPKTYAPSAGYGYWANAAGTGVGPHMIMASSPSGDNPGWQNETYAGSGPPQGETRNVCGISMTFDDLAGRLIGAGYGGPWDWDAMIAAYRAANPAQCGTSSGGGGGTSPGTGGTLPKPPGKFDLGTWANNNKYLIGGGIVAAIAVAASRKN